jgi:hypothetical protein
MRRIAASRSLKYDRVFKSRVGFGGVFFFFLAMRVTGLFSTREDKSK